MYTCIKCNKSFEDRRAYAGHMSSHKRGESYRKGRKKGIHKNKTHLCKYCGREFSSGVALGGHTGSCIKNPTRHIKISKTNKNWEGKKHSEETKKKISEAMIKAQKEGRAWNIGQSRWNNEQSYPEKFFEKFLTNEGIKFEKEYPIGRFSIDFALIENKIAIEIDGKTHFTEEETIQRDKRKNKKLEEEGWKTLRIKWGKMFNETQEILEEAKKFIKEPIIFKKLY